MKWHQVWGWVTVSFLCPHCCQCDFKKKVRNGIRKGGGAGSRHITLFFCCSYRFVHVLKKKTVCHCLCKLDIMVEFVRTFQKKPIRPVFESNSHTVQIINK